MSKRRMCPFLLIYLTAFAPIVFAAPKIALIGLDGADWRIIEPLVHQGLLPTFAALQTEGMSGLEIAGLPLLSPLIWTTIATGRTPDEHGILDFVEFNDTGQRRPISSYDRKCRALWNIFSERGRTVGIYGYWATWPAEAVKGEIASNLLFENLPLLHDLASGTAQPGGLAFPVDLVRRVVKRPVSTEILSRMTGMSRGECEKELSRKSSSPFENHLRHFSMILQSTSSLFELSLERLRAGQPDLFMVYFEGPDLVCHLFHETPGAFSSNGVVPRYYQLMDSMLAEYRRALDRDTILIICSDHGFLLPDEEGGEGDPADFFTGAASYHRRYGIFLAAGPGIRTGKTNIPILDFAPTILSGAGLPVAEDLAGHVAPIFMKTPSVTKVATFETSPLTRIKPEGLGDESLESLQALGYVFSPGPTFSINLGRVLLEKGDLDGAEKAIMHALQMDPKRASTLYDLFDLRRQLGDERGIIDVARRFVNIPSGLPPDVALAAIHASLDLEGTDKASALSRELLGAGQTPLQTLATGIIFAAKGNHEKAIASELSAVNASPALTGVALPELVAAYSKWNPLMGLKSLEQFKERHEYPMCRGQLLGAAGKFHEAALAYEEALAGAPDSTDLILSAAQARFRAGDLAGARTLFEQAIAIDPHSDAGLLGAGATAAATGDDRTAIRYIERCKYQQTPDALNALALAYRRQGNQQRAMDLLRSSLKLKPEQPAIQKLLSEIGSQ